MEVGFLGGLILSCCHLDLFDFCLGIGFLSMEWLAMMDDDMKSGLDLLALDVK